MNRNTRGVYMSVLCATSLMVLALGACAEDDDASDPDARADAGHMDAQGQSDTQPLALRVESILFRKKYGEPPGMPYEWFRSTAGYVRIRMDIDKTVRAGVATGCYEGRITFHEGPPRPEVLTEIEQWVGGLSKAAGAKDLPWDCGCGATCGGELLEIATNQGTLRFDGRDNFSICEVYHDDLPPALVSTAAAIEAAATQDMEPLIPREIELARWVPDVRSEDTPVEWPFAAALALADIPIVTSSSSPGKAVKDALAKSIWEFFDAHDAQAASEACTGGVWVQHGAERVRLLVRSVDPPYTLLD